MSGTPGFDVAVAGAGIVGLATARALVHDDPGLRVLVLEKEPAPAQHQTGRNSGVIHSGIYYRPGSLKARYCAQGARALTAYCDARSIPWRRTGKLIVATDDAEVPALDELHRRGVANGLDGLERLDGAGVRRAEPAVRGVAALLVPSTAIVDFRAVAAAMAEDLQAAGGAIVTGFRVESVEVGSRDVVLRGPAGVRTARVMVNCAGLFADRLARAAGADPGVRIIPFRGEYYRLREGLPHPVSRPVYPVPDARFPFLGVHVTPTVDGSLELGPNAVLATAREGYRKRDVRGRDLWDSVSFGGLWKLGRRYWRVGLGEVRRSFSTKSFVASLQQLVPSIGVDDVEPIEAGVRAQAITGAGDLVDDFHIVRGPRAVHVLNAPSPAATASLEIGRHIADLVREELDSA
jgi:(S)-2-hydroxyglutarate dehydrogenase